METIETSGVVIGVQSATETGSVAALDVFTVDFGIMKFFSRLRFPIEPACVFEDVALSGTKTTATAGNFHGVKFLSKNHDRMLQNGSLKQAKIFVDTMRNIVFDGVPLEDLLVITKQAIRNFALNFDPNVVLLKGLYLICREEGYAVDIDWLHSLPENDRTLAKEVISSELSHGARAENDISQLEALVSSLRHWTLSV
ncbi:MAG: hypothetical protein LBT64_02200 [Puniceicoccales bacterium]|jgi:hypothetical protein|nr:hypothetical protein [Puniceicoccales bacterium]